MMMMMMMRSRAYKNLPTPSARARVFGPKRCGAGVSVSVSVVVCTCICVCVRGPLAQIQIQMMIRVSVWVWVWMSACRAFLRTREESTQEQTSFRAVVATSDYTLNVVVSWRRRASSSVRFDSSRLCVFCCFFFCSLLFLLLPLFSGQIIFVSCCRFSKLPAEEAAAPACYILFST